LLYGGLFIVGIILSTSAQSLLTLYPKYDARIREIYILIAQFFELPYDEYLSIFDNIWGQADVRFRVRNLTLSFTNGFIRFLTNALMVSIFMVFLMFEAVFFRQKLDKAFPGPRAGRIKKIGTGVITEVTHYLSIMFFVSVLNGILAGVGLWIIGVEFAAIWGVIQFILNFIPNIGSIAAGVGATAFALVQFWPEPGPIAATGFVMLGVNILCGFIILPKVMGDRLGLSPLVVLVSLMIWGWLWGFAGLILAVPMMAIIKIICENFPVLEPISILMGSRKAALAKSAEDQEEVTLNQEDA
jgi:predicted PurR-regulated permease PerM